MRSMSHIPGNIGNSKTSCDSPGKLQSFSWSLLTLKYNCWQLLSTFLVSISHTRPSPSFSKGQIVLGHYMYSYSVLKIKWERTQYTQNRKGVLKECCTLFFLCIPQYPCISYTHTYPYTHAYPYALPYIISSLIYCLYVETSTICSSNYK